MLSTLQKRLAREEQGFTLIELLVVIIIIGILLAIAVPSYLSFRDRATDSKNQANIRAAIPSAEAFAADNNGDAADVDSNSTTSGYAGMTLALMKSEYDNGLSSEVRLAGTLDTDSYCLESGAAGTLHEFKYSVGNGDGDGNASNDGIIEQGSCD